MLVNFKIVLGVPVPKNIPMKMARVGKSIELESIKGAILQEKSSNKKIYKHIHAQMKGEDEPRNGVYIGPTNAPG